MQKNKIIVDYNKRNVLKVAKHNPRHVRRFMNNKGCN